MIASAASDRLTIIRAGRSTSPKTEVCFGMPTQFESQTVVKREGRPSQVFEPLSHYRSNDNKGVEVTLLLCRLPREIGAGELGEIELQQRGLTMKARRDDDKSPWQESRLIVDYPERKRCGRLKIVRFGDVAFGLEVTAPITCNPIIANACCQISDSLVVCAAPRQELAETLTKHSLGKHGKVSFELPESWTTHSQESEEVDNVLTLLGGGDEQTTFQPDDLSIKIELVEKDGESSPLEVARRAKEALETKGLFVGGSPIFPVATKIECDRAYVYSPRIQSRDDAAGEHDLCYGVMGFERGDQVLLITTTSVSRDSSLVWWSVAKRASAIMQDTLVWH